MCENLRISSRAMLWLGSENEHLLQSVEQYSSWEDLLFIWSRNFQPFVKPGSSLLCSQADAHIPFPGANKFLFNSHFNIIPHLYLGIPSSLPSGIVIVIFYFLCLYSFIYIWDIYSLLQGSYKWIVWTLTFWEEMLSSDSSPKSRTLPNNYCLLF